MVEILHQTLRRFVFSRLEVAMMSPLFNVGMMLCLLLRDFTTFQNSFWLWGCKFQKKLRFACLRFATTLFRSFLNMRRSSLLPLRWAFLKYRFLFLTSWMISLFSQGKFFLLGSTALWMHCSMMSRKVVLKHDQLIWMLEGSSISSSSTSHSRLLARSKSAWRYRQTQRRCGGTEDVEWCFRLTRSPRWSELASWGMTEHVERQLRLDTKTRSIREGCPLGEKWVGESTTWISHEVWKMRIQMMRRFKIYIKIT